MECEDAHDSSINFQKNFGNMDELYKFKNWVISKKAEGYTLDALRTEVGQRSEMDIWTRAKIMSVKQSVNKTLVVVRISGAKENTT